MAWLLIPFIGLALLGLMLSLVAHLCGVLGLAQPLGQATWGLHIGIFVVWFPAVVAGQSLDKDFKQKDHWKATLRGCPAWLRWTSYGFLTHAIVNFIVFMALTWANPPPGGPAAPPIVFAGVSGHWMAFYAMAAAMLWSYLVVRRHDSARCCLPRRVRRGLTRTQPPSTMAR